MALLDLLKSGSCKEIEKYFKDVVLPRIERYEPFTYPALKWSSVIEEDDRIRPLADSHTYLFKGKKFKPGKVYPATYKGPSGGKGACYILGDVGVAYKAERIGNLPNVYAIAKSETDVLLFVWKRR